MQFKEWIEHKGLSQADIARILRKGKPITPNDRCRVHRIVEKGYLPTQEEMHLLHHESGGVITANSFFGFDPPRKKRRRKTRSSS